MKEAEEILDRLLDLGGSDRPLTIGDIRECLGPDAFAPTLLVLGVVGLSPLGDLPGGSAVVGGLVAVVGAQMAVGKTELWLPQWLLMRQVSGRRLRQIAEVLRKPLRWLRPLVRTRIEWLVSGTNARILAFICIVLALTMPPLEVVPFGATVPSVVITGLALALVTRDGLLALLSIAPLIGGLSWLLAVIT